MIATCQGWLILVDLIVVLIKMSMVFKSNNSGNGSGINSSINSNSSSKVAATILFLAVALD